MSIYINKDKIIKTLKKCGIKRNDTLMLHCDLSKIGNFEGSLRQHFQNYLDSVKTLVGKNGTIAVPASYYEYSKKKCPLI